MQGIKNSFAASFLGLAMYFSGCVQAMEIPQFDNMPIDQRSHYLTWLVNGAAQALEAKNQHDQSVKLLALFQPVPGSASVGRIQFIQSLNSARQLNQQNENDKTIVPLEVEDALWAVLDQNGINVTSDELVAIGKTYKPDSGSGTSN